MSESTVEEIVQRASALPEADIATIVTSLISSLPNPSYDVSDVEVNERRRQLETGEVEEISLKDLVTGLDLPGN